VNRNLTRQSTNIFAIGLAYALTGVALVPLALVLIFTISKGLPPVLHPEFFTNVERPVGIPGAGIAHAIVGTLILVGIASLISIPIGILGGIFMSEYRTNRYANIVRLACDVLIGTPSIAIGLFAYTFFVLPFHHFSGLSGSLALAVLMLPIVMRTTENAVNLVPPGLRESGLALGLPRWRVSLQLIIPAAAAGVITGALLSVARAAGETAPLLFTAFGNPFLKFDPSSSMNALPLVVYHFALQPYKELQDQAWGAALVLIVIVLIINLASRFALRRQLRFVGQS
jgi:phosphate transport system permease protein